MHNKRWKIKTSHETLGLQNGKIYLQRNLRLFWALFFGWVSIIHQNYLITGHNKFTYENKVKNLMSRNRFELILRMWHLSDNKACPEGDRLFKIKHLIDLLLARFQAANIPKKEICIDFVPFRGKLAFKQFIKNKKHKFGIKVYKLCTENGFTYNMKVYCGRDVQPGAPAASSVVMELMANLLDSGRILYTDNFYTSVHLAHQLLEHSTHLVGTLRSNRKLNPQEVIQAKLNKNDTISRESNTGVVVLKWKDKRDVLTLSTIHDNRMVDIPKENGTITQKPQIVVDYNRSKGFIDISDQMKAYSAALRRGVKWYRKLAIELITGSALINAHILYKIIKKKNIKITSFKEEVTMALLQSEISETENLPTEDYSLNHMDARRRFGRKHAALKAKQTPYKCEKYKSYFCVECFFVKHKSFKL
ncbi:piggyBac transposable element-derived protein 4-like [Anthonomus grandis grandis]|uniref:piggyBac transposable element-derived protein 4-like n=1 Tax=Anthonomus grandis grandis TaxID=2921223 RepID=UPI0021665C8F|nr:piggyBac transposable element-derived protein 4-like [Anthonomus grandis grandis]